MKILLVNTRHFYGGGDSTYTFNLAELLSSHGFQAYQFRLAGTVSLWRVLLGVVSLAKRRIGALSGSPKV